MVREIKEQLSVNVQEWLSQSDSHTQSELARKTRISKANISHIASGGWKDRVISDAQWQKLNSFFGHTQHINTANFLNITNACQAAQKEKRTIGVDGYTGAGKSYALEAYSRKHANVFLIRCRRSMGVKSFIEETARQIGVKDSGRVYDIENRIIEKIESLSQPALIIFDECEYLKPAALDSIKTLTQELGGTCGIIVCGIIKQWLERMATRDKQGMPQFLRRIGHSWVMMKEVKNSEIRKFCNDNNITDSEVINMMIRDCTNYDMLQRYVKDLTKVSVRAETPVNAQLYANLFMS